jgi:hypothetical protein
MFRSWRIQLTVSRERPEEVQALLMSRDPEVRKARRDGAGTSQNPGKQKTLPRWHNSATGSRYPTFRETEKVKIGFSLNKSKTRKTEDNV